MSYRLFGGPSLLAWSSLSFMSPLCAVVLLVNVYPRLYMEAPFLEPGSLYFVQRDQLRSRSAVPPVFSVGSPVLKRLVPGQAEEGRGAVLPPPLSPPKIDGERENTSGFKQRAVAVVASSAVAPNCCLRDRGSQRDRVPSSFVRYLAQEFNSWFSVSVWCMVCSEVALVTLRSGADNKDRNGDKK